MSHYNQELDLIRRVLEIYDLKFLVGFLNTISSGGWNGQAIKQWVHGKASPKLKYAELQGLEMLLPSAPENRHYNFDFIDLFAGIGGIRRGFDAIGGRCVFTSEWNPYAVRTYKANYYSHPNNHIFNDDIRKVTLSNQEDYTADYRYKHIESLIPDHDVLLAGFPCQPFSIAGVSKKNALGRAHGFECKTQGTLFFDVACILEAKRPISFLLENVKNLKSHDKGRTFKIILETLDELGYWVSDVDSIGSDDPKVINGQYFVPQHRERIVLVGFRKDLGIHKDFTLKDIQKYFPLQAPKLGDILDKFVDEKYILSMKLWEYLYNYSIKHKKKGNGFGYGLVKESGITRTLSARYYKDGSEILVDRGFDPSRELYHPYNQAHRPRRLTPRECARLMGYDAPSESYFRIPVSDMQAYKQFGNSVVVPVFSAIADLMKSRILISKQINENKERMVA